MPVDYHFITSFLHKVEGKALRKGYVPMQNGKPIQNSGVTIGTGVDLGQQTQAGLLAMGVPASVVGALVPYLGLKRESAVQKLRALPLILSEDAVAALDRAVIGAYVDKTAQAFDRAAGRCSNMGAFRFADRPRQVQAVTVSLAYQLGLGGFPFTFDCLVRGNYGAAVRELSTPSAWGGRYMQRRQAEAGLLKEVQGA